MSRESFLQFVKRDAANARQQIRKLKRANPFLFPLYCELTSAKQELIATQAKVRRLAKQWQDFGADK